MREQVVVRYYGEDFFVPRGGEWRDGLERDLGFTPLNDAIWGEGNWVKCYECPLDAQGNPPYHHRLAHSDGNRPTT
jgi:hypothetical protein